MDIRLFSVKKLSICTLEFWTFVDPGFGQRGPNRPFSLARAVLWRVLPATTALYLAATDSDLV